MEPITTSTISIGSIFDNFFEVADFQREYVWSTDDVSRLLDDIWRSFSSKPKRQYFIGSIVLSSKNSNAFYIIDGQQRLSTLYLAMCGKKNRIKAIDPSSQEVSLIDNKLRALFLGERGALQEFRISLGTDNAKEIINSAYDGGTINAEPKDESAQRLKEAYDTCVDFYNLKIPDKVIAVDFLRYLIDQVCVLPYVASSMDHALIVFETLNSTGVGLTPIDLVKNNLFKHTQQEYWENLQEKWKDFLSILEQTGELPQRFLKYFILVTYSQTCADSEVFNWIKNNPDKTNIKEDAFNFLDTLESFAESYLNIINGKASDGSANPNVSNLRKLAGRARQHFPFLIAIKSFPKDKADKFIRATESVLIAYGIQRMYTGDIEKTFTEWTLLANKCQSTKEIEAFFANKVEPEIRRVGSSALDRLSKGDELSITKQKLVYLLCRLDAFLQMEAEPASVYKNIEQAYKGTDVEHILSKADDRWKDLGFSSQDEFSFYKHKIGNLTILEKPLNRAIKDKPFYDKKNDGYKHSKYLITKGIAEKIPGRNSLAKAIKFVETYNEWTKESIDSRQRNIVEIAAIAFGWR